MRSKTRSRKLWGSTVIALALVAAFFTTSAFSKGGGTWKAIAKKLKSAAKLEAKADYNLALARALLLPPGDERDDAIDEAKEEFGDAKEEAGDAFGARLDLAEELDEDVPYTVDIDPANFVKIIDNPFMPLTPGTTLTYEADTEDGEETIVVTVLHETRMIQGVECVVVRDTVSIDDEIVEDTHDWFAQDKEGNVWYFGEISLNYEDGRLVDVDGSWESGVDGALAGIVMPANPIVGDIYRSEFLLGEAEDYAEVLALDQDVSVEAGDFAGCLQTFDGTPIEPDAEEHKFYAPGIGVVLEVDLEDDERVELVSITIEK